MGTHDSSKGKCGICGSTNIYLEENVGWDIDDEGSEDQHMQHCRDCGAEQFVIDRYELDVDSPHHGRHYGNWLPKEK